MPSAEVKRIGCVQFDTNVPLSFLIFFCDIDKFSRHAGTEHRRCRPATNFRDGLSDDQMRASKMASSEETIPNYAIAICAIFGAVLLFVGVGLHPSAADPNIPAEAFAEYAADRLWVVSHLIELLGVVLMASAFLLINPVLAHGSARALAAVGRAGMTAGIGLAAALQAVDGVALKFMVDRWADTSGNAREYMFASAIAVRSVEIGFASITSIVFGLSIAIYGIAFLRDRRFFRSLALLAILTGLTMFASGILLAYQGFSNVAMTTNHIAGALLLVFAISTGVVMWRIFPASQRAAR